MLAFGSLARLPAHVAGNDVRFVVYNLFAGKFIDVSSLSLLS